MNSAGCRQLVLPCLGELHFGLRVVSGLSRDLLGCSLKISEACKLTFALRATRGARSPRLLNHIPWPGRQINIDRVQRRVRSDRDSDQYVWQEFARSAREYV